MKNATGFDKRLGKSKRELGIITPKAPRYKKYKNGKLKCHCLFRGKELWQECLPHKRWKIQQAYIQEMIKKYQEEEKKKKSAPVEKHSTATATV